jgi:hypothetical protein
VLHNFWINKREFVILLSIRIMKIHAALRKSAEYLTGNNERVNYYKVSFIKTISFGYK